MPIRHANSGISWDPRYQKLFGKIFKLGSNIDDNGQLPRYFLIISLNWDLLGPHFKKVLYKLTIKKILIFPQKIFHCNLRIPESRELFAGLMPLITY